MSVGSGITLVWKVGWPSSRRWRCRGSRCWRHQKGGQWGGDIPPSQLGGLGHY